MNQSTDREQIPYQGRRLSSDNKNTVFGPTLPAALVAGRSETLVIETTDCYGGRLTGDAESYSVTDTDKQNPVTGPIMVEGAEPGDVLCVYIQDISVADQGVSVIRPKVGILGSEIRKPFVYQAKISDDRVVINEELSVPLKPVVGILGVAPRHGEIKTEYPGRHGGNMDTLDLTVGSRIFLPVQVNGGLLALGSVKACMGDGQVTGTGVEVAAEVTVRVDILPGGRYSWPRLETKENYITITSASSVAQASKLAVMEMVRWLEQEKGLDFETAYLVVGISGNLHMSQWSNPLMTARMVLPRAVMNKIQKRSAASTRPIHMDIPDETIEEDPELGQPIPDSPPEPGEEAQEIEEAAEGSLTSTDEDSPGERADSQQRRRRWRRRRRPSGARRRSGEGERKEGATAKGSEASDTSSDTPGEEKRQEQVEPQGASGEKSPSGENMQGKGSATEGTVEPDLDQKPRPQRRRRSNSRRPRTYRSRPKSSGDGDKSDNRGDESGGGGEPPKLEGD
ncbi:MAG: acetamidase/formamidase family protein [Gemmatimonadota bacterium]|nr:acetamidase/formamidase family protein [Gemmatimonadota bacterium]